MKKKIVISAKQVKELRDITSAGILDSKNALIASNGDVTKAIKWLQENGALKAIKKAGRIAAEGIVKAVVKKNKAIIIEVNSETDFVASNDKFVKLVDLILMTILESEAKSIDDVLKLKIDSDTIQQHLTLLTSTIGENIKIRRFKLFNKKSNESFGFYNHVNNKISVVVLLSNLELEELGRNIAMHIAAMNPLYINDKSIGEDTFEQIQKELMNQLSDSYKKKPKDILLKHIIPGKLKKHLSQITLYGQQYIKNTDLKIEDKLKENNCSVENFVRYELAEGIEKQELNFKEEVEKAKNI